MPLRVAYASTVHKSQGLSLDRVQVSIRDAFFKTPGMLYVALSRARTADGLRLIGSEAALVERCTCDPRLQEYL
jgi:ATP-dependent exoDNAse (exonuclease V) alpha subunit